MPEQSTSEGRRRAQALMASLRKVLEICGEIRREQAGGKEPPEDAPATPKQQ